MSKYILLLILCGLSLTSMAQTAARQTVTTFEVGTWENTTYEAKALDTEAKAWCTKQATQFVPRTLPGILTWEGSMLVENATSGWVLHTYWSQGDLQLSVRFELWQQAKQLLLPEVGAYQACSCTDCGAVDFGTEPMTCTCAEGETCLYQMGETLH